MDEIIRQRMYNIYQGQIPLINGAQIPIHYEGEIYGSGFVDLPGSRQFIQNDGNLVLDYDDWAEMVARQLAAMNTNVEPQQSDEQKILFKKLKENPDDKDSIDALIASLKKMKGGKLPKLSRVQHMKNVFSDLNSKMSQFGAHPRKIAETFFNGFQKSGGNMRDMFFMLNREPHVYDYYQYY